MRGEFLWIRVAIDITKALPHCYKLRSEGEHVDWALKFERLPNFCYWCGWVNHGERDCEVFIQERGKLKKDEQQYGGWLRAEPLRQYQNTVVHVAGSSRTQAPWKKGPVIPKKKESLGSNMDVQIFNTEDDIVVDDGECAQNGC